MLNILLNVLMPHLLLTCFSLSVLYMSSKDIGVILEHASCDFFIFSELNIYTIAQKLSLRSNYKEILFTSAELQVTLSKIIKQNTNKNYF